MTVTVTVTAAVCGALLGPTLAALTHRVPAGRPRLTRGLIRGAPALARRIAGVSAAAAGTFAVLAAGLGAVAELPAFLLMGAAGVVLAVVDVEHHRLPNLVILATYLAGGTLLAAAAAATGDLASWLRALAASVAVFALFFLLALISPRGFGFGDVKLGGLLGLYLGWLGWGHVAVGVTLGFLVGAAAAVVLVLAGRASIRTPVAFGPALLTGALIAVVAGPDLLSAYAG